MPAPVVLDGQRQTGVGRPCRDFQYDVTGGAPDGMLDGVGGGLSDGEQDVGGGGGIDRRGRQPGAQPGADDGQAGRYRG